MKAAFTDSDGSSAQGAGGTYDSVTVKAAAPRRGGLRQ